MSFVNFELFCTFFYCILCWFRYVNANWYQHNTSITPSNQIYLTLILYTYFVAILQGLRKQPSIFIIMMVSLHRVKIQHIRPCILFNWFDRCFYSNWCLSRYRFFYFPIFLFFEQASKGKGLTKIAFNLLVLVLAQAKVFTLVKSYFFNFLCFWNIFPSCLYPLILCFIGKYLPL